MISYYWAPTTHQKQSDGCCVLFLFLHGAGAFPSLYLWSGAVFLPLLVGGAVFHPPPLVWCSFHPLPLWVVLPFSSSLFLRGAAWPLSFGGAAFASPLWCGVASLYPPFGWKCFFRVEAAQSKRKEGSTTQEVKATPPKEGWESSTSKKEKWRSTTEERETAPLQKQRQSQCSTTHMKEGCSLPWESAAFSFSFRVVLFLCPSSFGMVPFLFPSSPLPRARLLGFVWGGKKHHAKKDRGTTTLHWPFTFYLLPSTFYHVLFTFYLLPFTFTKKEAGRTAVPPNRRGESSTTQKQEGRNAAPSTSESKNAAPPKRMRRVHSTTPKRRRMDHHYTLLCVSFHYYCTPLCF